MPTDAPAYQVRLEAAILLALCTGTLYMCGWQWDRGCLTAYGVSFAPFSLDNSSVIAAGYESITTSLQEKTLLSGLTAILLFLVLAVLYTSTQCYRDTVAQLQKEFPNASRFATSLKYWYSRWNVVLLVAAANIWLVQDAWANGKGRATGGLSCESGLPTGMVTAVLEHPDGGIDSVSGQVIKGDNSRLAIRTGSGVAIVRVDQARSIRMREDTPVKPSTETSTGTSRAAVTRSVERDGAR